MVYTGDRAGLAIASARGAALFRAYDSARTVDARCGASNRAWPAGRCVSVGASEAQRDSAQQSCANRTLATFLDINYAAVRCLANSRHCLVQLARANTLPGNAYKRVCSRSPAREFSRQRVALLVGNLA